ncbi:MAG: outer membrane beta-barrel protein [Janthinobacterium lividum]
MSYRLRFALLLCLTLVFGALAAQAQIAIYGMGSGGFLGSTNASQGSLIAQNSGFSAYGGTFGLYNDFLRLGPLNLGGDVRYLQQTSSNDNSYGNKLRGGLVGLRLALKLPVVPFKPYVQAEVGDVATNYGTQPNETNSFAYQVQGGLDYTIFPHLDLRGEYGGGQINGYGYGNGQKQALQQASLGLVVRFF